MAKKYESQFQPQRNLQKNLLTKHGEKKLKSQHCGQLFASQKTETKIKGPIL